MITPEELKALPEDLVILYEKLEDDIIFDISQSIAKKGVISETAELRLDIANKLGIDIKKQILELSNLSHKEIQSILEDLAIRNMDTDNQIYKAAGLNPKTFKQSPEIIQYVTAVINKTKGDLADITGTIGFARYKTGTTFIAADDVYRDIVNFGNIKLSSGAYSYDQVVKEAARELADSGIRYVDYVSGVIRHVDVAVRSSILTSANQMAGEISLMNANSMGCDLMEITAHSRARPSHAEWQGQLVSLSGREGYLSQRDIKYGDVAGFQGANCRHSWFPFFEGISSRAYSNKMLNNIDSPPFEYEGKTYTAYEASQKLRQTERNMRKTKRRLVAYEGAKAEQEFIAESIKLRRQKDFYNDFANKAGIRVENARHQTYKYDRSVSMKAVWSNKQSIHNKYKGYLGTTNFSNTMIKLNEIEKQNNKWLLDGFVKAVDKKEVSALVGIDKYIEVAKNIDKELVGTTTKNGIEIKGFVTHFVNRVIGQHAAGDIPKKGMRQGVPIKSIKDTLENPLDISETIKKSNGKNSIVFSGVNCKVSVNPDTKFIIQTNPRK